MAFFGLKPISIPSVGSEILDLIFTQSAILLNDVAISQKDYTLPLLGFHYMIPNDLPLLAYKYSEYPFLNKNVIKSCAIKEQTRFSLQGINAITNYVGVISSMAFNEGIIRFLDDYILKGGTFTILSPWGIINPCVCDSVSGRKLGDNDIGGQSLIFNFSTLKINSSKIVNQISESLRQLS